MVLYVYTRLENVNGKSLPRDARKTGRGTAGDEERSHPFLTSRDRSRSRFRKNMQATLGTAGARGSRCELSHFSHHRPACSQEVQANRAARAPKKCVAKPRLSVRSRRDRSRSAGKSAKSR